VHPDAAALIAVLDGLPAHPGPVPWLPDRAEVLPPAGVDDRGIPEPLRTALRRAGIPLRRGGSPQWGATLTEDPALEAPVLADGHLRVPVAQALDRCHAIALRPLRRWVADRFGVLIKTAPGIVLAPWHDHALLINTRDLLLGGFAYGPLVGQRAAVHLPPGAWQVIRW
jgi:hypothetical protein